MKKPELNPIIILTALFAAFLLGFFLARQVYSGQVLVSIPVLSASQSQLSELSTSSAEEFTFPININTAGKDALTNLPGIGDVLAERILEYRQEFGNFEAPEDLMKVSGISEKRFEQLAEYITTGG